MTRKTMSIRGETVDFDLFTIKQQILNTPKSDDTKKRERFIDKKRRRTSRNSIDQLIAQQQTNEAAVREALAKKAAGVVEASTEASEVTETTEAVQPTEVTTDAVKAPKRIIKKK